MLRSLFSEPDRRSRLKPRSRVLNLTPFAVSICAIAISAVCFAPARQTQVDPCSIPPGPSCFVPPIRDIAFIVDASGSTATRGQSYNAAIEGVIRAVGDSTIIPRNGSVAVAVVVFDGAATVAVPLTDINSSAVADSIVAKLNTLKCADPSSIVFPCPAGQTVYTAGIQAADANVNQTRGANPKAGVSRAYLLITDGQPEDPDLGINAVNEARIASTILGIPFEFDVVLLGLDTASPEFAASKARVDQLVFPQPTDSLPGATFAIDAGDCNVPGAGFNADCSRQSNQLAEFARQIVRGPVPTLTLEVATGADPASGQASGLTLRQALSMANCNGGATTITFDDSLHGTTITLSSALPPITAPDVVIDACDGSGADCEPGVTIDGGGTVADGLALRSNRNTIRGLRLINFTRAGIAIEPRCPADAVGHNVVEHNALENNPFGVLVKQFGDQTGNENVRNRISRNTFSRPVPGAGAAPSTLIDLKGDGPTPNDTGDADQGPNTLLNFPDVLGVIAGANNTVTVSGTLNSPPAAGAIVEIYEVTGSRVVDGKVVVDAASFLGEAAVGAGGAFTAAGLPPATSGVYSALVINGGAGDNPVDSSADTSELMFDSDQTPLPKSKATVTTSVSFGDAQLGTPQNRPVTITNTGTAPLVIRSCSIGRCPGANTDNRSQFSVTGCPTGPINPGQTATITVTFNAAECGPAAACLILETNDPLLPQVFTALSGNGAAPAHAVVQGGITSLTFKRINAAGAPRTNPKTLTFTVNNTGCVGLQIQRATLARVTGSNVQPDNSNTFSVTPVGQTTTFPVTISARGSVTFRVAFNPVIPGVVEGTPSVRDVLPDDVTDRLTLDADNGEQVTLTLFGRIKKPFVFIDPDNPANSPSARLCRSGDEFIVEFSAYDPNLNLSRANYQFLDASGRLVGGSIDVDIQQAIAGRNIQKGQSVTVTQRFSGADDNRRVNAVQISVTDGETNRGIRATGVETGCSTTARAGASLTATRSLALFEDRASTRTRRRPGGQK